MDGEMQSSVSQSSVSTESTVSTPTSTENHASESPTTSENHATNTNSSVTHENRSTSQSDGLETKSNILSTVNGENGSNGFALVDDGTGRRVLKPISNTQSEEQAVEQNSQVDVPNSADADGNSVAQTIDQMQQQIQEEQIAPTYTLEEFSQAIATNTVNEARVPAEYQQQYANYKINQAIAQQNALVEQQRQMQAAQQAQIQQQLSPEQKQEQMHTFLRNLDAEAEKRASEQVGFTDEDIENLEFMSDDDEKKIDYELAKAWHRQELMNGLQQRAAQEEQVRRAQASVYNSITEFTNKARAEEPNFNEIDRIMMNRYKSLPYEQGRQIETVISALQNGTITYQETEVLQKYYEDTRKEYYAKKNNLTTTPRAVNRPPSVERAGDGRASADGEYRPDYNALRGANLRGRQAWIKDFIKNRSR